jgi:hypothetical protein
MDDEIIIKEKVGIKKNTFLYAFFDFIKFYIYYANIPAILLYICSILLYMMSLKGCPDGQAVCLKNLNEGEVRELGRYVFYSACLASILIIGCLHKLISYYFLLLITISYTYLCFIYDTGSDLQFHGAYNRALFFLELVFCLIFIFLIIIILNLLFKYFKLTIFFIALLFFTLYSFYSYRIYTSCDNWLIGLKGIKLDNNHDACKIKSPNVCYIDILSGLFDYARWLQEDCKIFRGGDKNVFYKYQKKENFTKIAFPLTNTFKHYPDSKYLIFQRNVLTNMIDLDQPKIQHENKQNFEVFIDFSTGKSKLIMQMTKDEKKIKDRILLYQKTLNTPNRSLSKNFLYVYIDSLSRSHFYRKLPKLKKYIEGYYQTEGKKFRSYQFHRFQNLGYFTNINMIPVWFGVWWMINEKGKYYVTSFKEKGFITGQSVNTCARGIFDFDTDDHKKLAWDNYDHENVGMFCDPNFFGEDNPYTPFLGPYSVKRRCLHGDDSSQHVIDYTKLFWRTYKDEPKMFRMSFLDAHEGTGEIVKYLDDKLVNFFTDMEKENLLDDTIVLFMADHGMNMPGVTGLLNGEDHQKEKYNPFLFLMIPDKISDLYGFNLSDNEQEMITMWDIRKTLLHIAGDSGSLQKEKKGMSLFQKINSSNRDCEKMNTRADYCICNK